MEIRGAVALVTGGSEGIGKGIAAALRREGAAVTITGRREGVLRTAAEEVGVEWIRADVGVEEDAVRTVTEVVGSKGFPQACAFAAILDQEGQVTIPRGDAQIGPGSEVLLVSSTDDLPRVISFLTE